MVVQHEGQSRARFSDGNTIRYADVPYPFLHPVGERVEVIYEASDPAQARQYGVLGYWISFGELIASLVIVLTLYFVATSITSNPTPEALLEEMEMGRKKPRKPRYKTD